MRVASVFVLFAFVFAFVRFSFCSFVLVFALLFAYDCLDVCSILYFELEVHSLEVHSLEEADISSRSKAEELYSLRTLSVSVVVSN